MASVKIGSDCTLRAFRSKTMQSHQFRVVLWPDSDLRFEQRKLRSAFVQSAKRGDMDRVSTTRISHERVLRSGRQRVKMFAEAVVCSAGHGRSFSLPARRFSRTSSRTGRSRPPSAKSASIWRSHSTFSRWPMKEASSARSAGESVFTASLISARLISPINKAKRQNGETWRVSVIGGGCPPARAPAGLSKAADFARITSSNQEARKGETFPS